ncbi:MAG: hypothetical protein RIR00_1344 [Pseudomonadota bacterium]|jgi:flagellar biosynthesis protein FlhF
MNVRKFIAANARDALRKVKETLGPDAIILSNRSVPGGVEIMAVAARDMAMIVPSHGAEESPVARPAATRPALVDDHEDYRVSFSRPREAAPAPQAQAAAPLNAQPAPRPVAPPRVHHAIPQVAAAQAEALARQQAEILARQQAEESARPRAEARQHGETARQHDPVRVESVHHGDPKPSSRYRDTAHGAGVNAFIPKPTALRNADIPNRTPLSAVAQQLGAEAEVVPASVMEEIRALRQIVEQHLAGYAWGESNRVAPVRTGLMRQMLDAGFSPQFARDLLAELPQQLEHPAALSWAKAAADRHLLTLGSDADIIDRGGIYALVGPTGVGKTTTTAKLAARCVLRHGAHKLALITTDAYRIGAYEQLRIYGRILGVSVHQAKDTLELRQLLLELQHKHMILIDTMGMSQKDKLVGEQTDMLAGCHVRRLLLLSATSRGDTLDDVVRAYRGDDLAGCILTKVDEAAGLAAAMDGLIRHKLTLYYVSNGQRVPEDLHLPNRPYLLHRAFKEVPDNSPHHHQGMEPALVMANAGLMGAVAGGRHG